jgi:hypothetical protein
MKLLGLSALGLCMLVGAMVCPAQSSRDYWDGIFHKKDLKQRKDQFLQKWVESWKDRRCTVADVKRYYAVACMRPEPDTLNPTYYDVLRTNAEVQAALQSHKYDVELQDIADRMNIAVLLEKGLTEQAATLNKSREQRLLVYEQRQRNQQAIKANREMREISVFRRLDSSSVERNAYGSGINSDEFGRPHVYRTHQGEMVYGKVERDAYGPGAHSDEFGRVVYDSAP